MEHFEIIIEGESYKVVQHNEDPFTYQILYPGGMHQIGKLDDGTWIYLKQEPLTPQIPLKRLGEEIDNLLNY